MQSSNANFDDLPLDSHIKLPYMLKDQATFVAFLKPAFHGNVIQLWCESETEHFPLCFSSSLTPRWYEQRGRLVRDLLATYVNALPLAPLWFSMPLSPWACAHAIPPPTPPLFSHCKTFLQTKSHAIVLCVMQIQTGNKILNENPERTSISLLCGGYGPNVCVFPQVHNFNL